MKAYYIGGCMDQFKQLIPDNSPPKLDRFLVREPLPPEGPYTEELAKVTNSGMMEIHYHNYRLWKVHTPWNDETIAVYIYDDTFESPRQRVRNGIKR